MTGKGSMPGICTLIDLYLKEQDIAEATRQILLSQVNVVRQRATGERMTNATWIRQFVHDHPAYNHDSIISHEINYDLMKALIHLYPEELLNQ
jgi:glutamate--cysteine ligase catalytic subunit